ncbi:hypothetical protein PVAG01_09801 [Phlyctema vagabunda]|uniref:Uncharacterized protein n=1 Tax=Phlyctema vagabunda TaxID=108571 RepID=A0ABR4P4R3_9HELO
MAKATRTTVLPPTRQDSTDTFDATLYKGTKQPEPKVRLQQIINFLGDEDYYRKIHFIAHLSEIDQYLQHVEPAISKESEGSTLAQAYNDAKIMVSVHKHLLRESKKEITAKLRAESKTDSTWTIPAKNELALLNKILAERVDVAAHESIIPQPMRLRTGDDSAKSERRIKGDLHTIRPNEPPFTLIKEIDHVEFRNQFRDKLEGISSVENRFFHEIEKEAYTAALQHPRMIEEFDELQILGTEGRFEDRARLRGARRAGIEMLLNRIAGNEEQTRHGQKFRRVELPTWTPPPKEIPLSKGLLPSQRPLELPTFFSAAAMLQARRAIQADYEKSLVANPIESDGVRDIPVPKEFAAPQLFLEGDELEHAYHQYEIEKAATREVCLDLYRDFRANVYNRPLSTTIAEYIRSGIDSVEVPADLQTRVAIEVCPGKLKATLRKLLDKDRSEAAHLVLLDDWQPQTQPPTPSTLEFAKIVMGLEEYIPIWNDPNGSQKDITAEDVTKMIVDQIIAEQKNIDQTTSQPKAADVFLTNDQVKSVLEFMARENLLHGTDSNAVVRIWRGDGVSPESLYKIGSSDDTLNTHSPATRVLAHEFEHVDWSLFETPEDFFSILAFKLGRMIRAATEGYENGKPVYPALAERLDYHFLATQFSKKGMAESCELTKLDRSPLRAHAKDLHTHVNSHAAEAKLENFCPKGSSEADCAKIVQMEILEELNNNYDNIFPEQEDVWSFASDRLGIARQPGFVVPNDSGLETIRTTINQVDEEIEKLLEFQINKPEKWTRKIFDRLMALEDVVEELEDATGIKKPITRYFDIRTWPVESQVEDLQDAIVNSGPVVQEGPVKRKRSSRTAGPRRIHETAHERRREQHFGRGQWPLMPFGETKYQQQWMSFQMSHDLANVPQFMRRDEYGNLINVAGYLVDENLNLINKDGQHVNIYGRRVSKPIKAPEVHHDDPPLQPVRKPREDKGRFALPELDSSWKPDTVSAGDFERQIVMNIYDDKDLLAQVGPDSILFDDMVMSEPAADLLHDLTRNPQAKIKMLAKRAADTTFEIPDKKKVREGRRDVAQSLRTRKPGFLLSPPQSAESDATRSQSSIETRKTPHEESNLDAIYRRAYEALAPRPVAADEVMQESGADSSGDSQVEHENEAVVLPANGSTPIRRYTYKGRIHKRPYVIEKNDVLDEAWRKIRESDDYVDPVEAAHAIGQPGGYEAFKRQTIAERQQARRAGAPEQRRQSPRKNAARQASQGASAAASSRASSRMPPPPPPSPPPSRSAASTSTATATPKTPTNRKLRFMP